jgi:hypothetical protein
MTAIESVWDRMKSAATEFAARRALPSKSRVRALVLQFIREANADTPPPDAIDFLVNEMLSMVDCAHTDEPART